MGRMLSLDPAVTLHEVLAEKATVADALTTTRDGLRVVSGNPSLDAYPSAKPSNLGAVIEQLKQQFDVVLIDVNAAVSDATFQAYAASDAVLLLSLPTEVAMEDTQKARELVTKAETDVLGVVINRIDQKRFIDRAREVFDVQVLGAIPERSGSTLTHPVVTTAENSPTAEAYRDLADGLVSVFADGIDPSDIDPVVRDSWFESTDQTNGNSDDGEDEEDGGLLI